MKDSKMMPKSMLSFGLLAMAAASPVWSATIYVDSTATGASNGSSWMDAYNNLQDALDLAAAFSGDDEIQVAAGTYYPDEGAGETNDDPASTFNLVAGVTIKGGYPAGGGTRAAAMCNGGDYHGLPCASNDDCPTGGTCSGNKTYLSGDLANDDASCTAGECCLGGKCVDADNATHVVTYALNSATVTATLDGFIIERGFADGDCSTKPQGAAVHIRNGSAKCQAGGPTLKNCVFRHNLSRHHGAVNDHGFGTTIDNCLFLGNRTTCAAAEGGALNIHSGSPTVQGCVFVENYGSGDGGAVWAGCDDDDPSCLAAGTCDSDATLPRPRIIGCTFESNSAARGGGIFLDRSNATVDGCNFSANVATGGGGAWTEDGRATFSNCAFCDNSAGQTGGGGSYHQGGSTLLSYCDFDGNTAPHGGGAYFNLALGGRIEDSTFVGNSANGSYGGGVYVGLSEVDIIGSTFSENYGEAAAGALYAGGGSDFDVANSTFTGNSTGGLFGGGAFSTDGGTHSFVNCVFRNNITSAITLYNADTTITNCIFVENDPTGLWDSGFTTMIQNSILWDNVLGQVMPLCVEPNCGACSATRTVEYSIVEGGYCGTQNSGSDPLFVDSPDDLHLSAGSPGIDSGDNDALLGVSCTADADCIEPAEWCSSGTCVLAADASGCVRRMDDPSTGNTGNAGTLGLPIVERGAFEYGAPVESGFDADEVLNASCAADGDCLNTAVCIQGTCYTPKNRYVTFSPGNQATPLAFKVTIAQSSLFPGAAGIAKWVGVPDASGIARLVCNCPPYKSNWPATIQVADGEIVPGSVYEIRSIQQGLDTTNPNNYSAPISIPTSAAWGDCVGQEITLSCSPAESYWSPPDGLATTGDVDACVERFQALPDAPPASWMDVDPRVPNKIVDFSDISALVNARAGYSYPFSGPVACSDTGPCGACCTCKFGSCTCTQKTQTACGSGTWTQGASCGQVQCSGGPD